jgi:transposase
MKVTTFGLDLAKRVFQVHWVEMETGEICRRQLKREQVAQFFANRAPALVAMEACGSAHYWGRRLTGLGHEVRLIATQFVRPFVKNNKTDAADAQAIWKAAQRPGMRFVALKSEGQQGVLMMHRMREQLVKMRTMRGPRSQTTAGRGAHGGKTRADALTRWRRPRHVITEAPPRAEPPAPPAASSRTGTASQSAARGRYASRTPRRSCRAAPCPARAGAR